MARHLVAARRLLPQAGMPPPRHHLLPSTSTAADISVAAVADGSLPTAGHTRNATACALLIIIALFESSPGTLAGQAIAPRIAAGDTFSAALSSHGVLWTWGDNTSGQLGRSGSNATPLPVSGLSQVLDISCGSGHTLALTAAGTVMSWGYNVAGRLGLGNYTSAPRPQLIPTISAAVAISAGTVHSLVLRANGTGLAFGYGEHGRLGRGNTNNHPTPTLIPSLNNVVAISAGYQHSAAVLASGALHVWGDNFAGQLATTAGIGTSLTPIPVTGLTGIVSAACGQWCTVCVDATGVVYQWGTTGATTQWTPLVQALPSPAISVAASRGTAVKMARSSAGSVFAWGIGCAGQIGASLAVNCTPVGTPLQPTGLGAGIAAISMGDYHGTAMSQSGAVYSWGSNTYMQLGYSTPVNIVYSPVAIPSLDLNVFARYLVAVGLYSELRYFHGEPLTLYANMCTTASQAPPTSRLLNVGGLWLTFPDLFAWATLIQAGYPMATGPISAAGTAVTTLPIPNSALTCITINAIAFKHAAGHGCAHAGAHIHMTGEELGKRPLWPTGAWKHALRQLSAADDRLGRCSG